MTTLASLRKEVYRSGWPYALEMIDAIESKSDNDELYAVAVSRYLSGDVDSPTVFLRDELCSGFKDYSFVKYYKGKMPMPWDNMWQAIDSAHLHLKQGDCK